jgi:ABC-type transport system involved in multi-copper enzyme maturation permease subunit
MVTEAQGCDYVSDWIALVRAEFDKLHSDNVLRAVVVAITSGPLVIVLILWSVSSDISHVLEQPGPIPLGTAVLLTGIGAAVLAASTFGREYDIGTVRTILERGVSRDGWITAKMVVLVLSLSLASLVSVGLGLGATSLAGWHPHEGEAVELIARAVVVLPLSCLTYGGMAALGSILGRSAAAGMIAGLALFLGDFLLSTGRPLSPLGSWLPAGNLLSMIGGAFSSVIPTEGKVTVGIAALRLLTVGIALLSSAILIFSRRDVTG